VYGPLYIALWSGISRSILRESVKTLFSNSTFLRDLDCHSLSYTINDASTNPL
jgi:hypothetical protein